MSDVLVSVENVGKKFCRSLKKSLWYGVQDMAGEILGCCREHDLRADEFWAVKDVSFELKRGECLGLIGRNGAGKTTLLRLLNGLIKPDHGRIEVRGRVGALIALGAGFNPILTGRENIYVNASVLGLKKKEIDNKIDEIIDFSEIGEFIDSPVQNYSSGMNVRLGFGIAASLDPDILILDEVLAVGDIRFRAKCYNKLQSMFDRCAVILVSHNTEDVARLCTRVNLLEHGGSQYLGPVEGGIRRYLEANGPMDNKALIVAADYLDITVTNVVVDIESASKNVGSIKIQAHITAKYTTSEIRLVWCLLDSEGRNVCVSVASPLDIIAQRSYSLLSELSELRLCRGIYQIAANIIRVNPAPSGQYPEYPDNWELLASFRNLGQIIWNSQKIIPFGSNVFMPSETTLHDIG
ncbi:MAG: ABC transporter ATP-binding protein [Geobacteraceae bacterium]|nr:ABC transporter ATP-binding protein [Geobacteraceae bacterium]NTW79437.1 ABC transporter ATP-binding protein [Geobacteraceae bacterium]